MISEILRFLSGFAAWKAAAEESQGSQSVPKLPGCDAFVRGHGGGRNLVEYVEYIFIYKYII